MTISAEAMALLREEEVALEQTLHSLREQLSRNITRLAREQERARELTARIVATRRDEDKQLLASDEAVSHGLSKIKRGEIDDLERLLERPYFARIVLEEEQPNGTHKRMEYKIGNLSNLDCRIIDWKRAPVSKLYYEYKEGDSYCEEILDRERIGRVILRHKLEIEEGRLKRVSCRYGTFDLVDGVWKVSEGRRSTKNRSYGALPDVLSLITAEQFRAITADATSAVLIQGVAGSGKTTVAIHRLQWLLSQEGRALNHSGVRIVVRSPVLRRYIEHTLSSLGLNTIKVATFGDWIAAQARSVVNYVARERHVPSITIEEHAPTHPSVIRVKRSFAVLRALEDYVTDQHNRLVQWIENEAPWSELPEQFCLQLRKNLPRFNAPIELCDVLIRQVESARSDLDHKSSEQYLKWFDKLQHLRRKLLLFVDDLLQILRSPERILKHDETKLLDRELVIQASDDLRQRLERGALGLEDAGLLVQLFQLKVGGSAASETMDHNLEQLVVDEVQDFSALELATLIKSVASIDRLTLVGDAAQSISKESVFPGWDKLRHHYRFADSLSKFVALDVNYRSALPIVRVAQGLIGGNYLGPGRNGVKPTWYKSLSEDHGVRSAVDWLSSRLEDDPNQLIAVLTSNREQAAYVVSLLNPTFGELARLGDDTTFSFEEGIIVAPVTSVKGLEFPSVLVWDVSAANYPVSEINRRLLYVACTRAEDYLAFVSWGAPSKIVSSISSNLVDVAEEEIPVDEVDDVDLSGYGI